MKLFNLKEALDGANVVTRQGKKVSELHFFKTASPSEDYTIVAVADGYLRLFTKNGCYLNNGQYSIYDLVMEDV